MGEERAAAAAFCFFPLLRLSSCGQQTMVRRAHQSCRLLPNPNRRPNRGHRLFHQQGRNERLPLPSRQHYPLACARRRLHRSVSQRGTRPAGGRVQQRSLHLGPCRWVCWHSIFEHERVLHWSVAGDASPSVQLSVAAPPLQPATLPPSACCPSAPLPARWLLMTLISCGWVSSAGSVGDWLAGSGSAGLLQDALGTHSSSHALRSLSPRVFATTSPTRCLLRWSRWCKAAPHQWWSRRAGETSRLPPAMCLLQGRASCRGMTACAAHPSRGPAALLRATTSKLGSTSLERRGPL